MTKLSWKIVRIIGNKAYELEIPQHMNTAWSYTDFSPLEDVFGAK